jgi:type I restriction enzyme S subunit
MYNLSAAELTRALERSPLMIAAKVATEYQSGWQSGPIRDYVEQVSTGTTPPSTIERYYGGNINWYTPTDIGGLLYLEDASRKLARDAVDEKKARVFEKDTVLITCIGQIGRLGIATSSCSANQQITGIKFQNCIFPEFAYYALFARRALLESAAPTASTLPILNQSRLLQIEFSFPEYQEQQQIASFLAWYHNLLLNGKCFDFESCPQLPIHLRSLPDIIVYIEALAARIAEAHGLRQQAVEEAEAIVGSAKRAIFNSESIERWNPHLLGDIADIVSGVTLGRHLTGPTIRLPYLRVANVQDGHLELGEIKEVDIRESELEKWQLKIGDILLTEGGDWDKLGRGTVWQGEIPNCIHQNHIFRVRVNIAEFDPRFLMSLISSPYGKSYFQSASKQTTNLASINQRQLKSFTIFQPPMTEQRHIVAYLDDLHARVDALKRLQAETAAELDALLPAVLDRAFHLTP